MLTVFEKKVNKIAGERVKIARREIGLSQIELAKNLGIANDRLCKYELGIVLVPAWVLMVVEEELLPEYRNKQRKSVIQS